MGFLPDELKIQTFPCPHCKQYISSEAKNCRFCSEPITIEMRDVAVATEQKEKKNIFLNDHKNTIILGSVFLVIGIGSVFSDFISSKLSDSFYFGCLGPVFLIGGTILLIKGLSSYLREKKSN